MNELYLVLKSFEDEASLCSFGIVELNMAAGSLQHLI